MGYNSKGYKTKNLTVKKLGWKRIARNVERFGWVLDDATVHTDITETTTYEGRVSGDTIYINPRTNRTSRTRVWLSFYRAINVGAGVAALETFYNLLYIVRKIVAFFLPIAFIGATILGLSGGTELAIMIFPWVLAAFFVWIGCIIFEGVFARIAASILKKRAAPKYSADTLRFTLYSRTGGENDIITLQDKNGNNNYKFEEIGGINYGGNYYAVLYPLDEEDEDAKLVFKVTHAAGGKEIFELEQNNDILHAVYMEYYRLLDEAESQRTA